MTNASANATVDEENFANNAFTDFAPLLTLFGDEVTKQYLATSMGIADAVMLGIAPIGMITIIVSAIRVGGHRLMKSLVGRARDASDDDEKEILSSTSPNVREIWNGNRVVRQTGDSKTTILALAEDRFKVNGVAQRVWRLDELGKADYVAFGITHDSRRLFEEFEAAGDLKSKFRVLFDRRKRAKNADELGALDFSSRPLLSEKVPPNLTLNFQGAIPKKSEVITLACVGFLVQAAVMIINAIVVYRWHWRRAGKIVMAYGYPTWAVGTSALSIGTFICGWIVETSCRKVTIVCKKLALPHNEPEEDRPLKIVFLQKKISAQDFPAYAIMSILPGNPIHISRRIYPPVLQETSDTYHGLQKGKPLQPGTRRRNWLTVLGAGLSLCGFVLQNIGTRELHWSAGLLQLGAILIMTLLRAWLRHGVGNSLEDSSQELDRGYEACNLGQSLTKSRCYLPILFGKFSFTNAGIPEELKRLVGDGKPFVSSNQSPHIDFRLESLVGHHSAPGYRSLRSFLQTQAFLEDCEPDVKEDCNMALDCCKAMEEILMLLHEDEDLQKINNASYLQGLGPFTYLVYTDDFDPSFEAYHKASRPGVYETLIPAELPTPGGFENPVRLLQVIIKATRHAHMHPTSKLRSSHLVMTRIIGNCTSDNLEAYLEVLGTFFDPQGFHIKRTHLGLQDVRPLDMQKDTICLIFGVLFSSSSPKNLHMTGNAEKSVDSQEPYCFDLEVGCATTGDITKDFDRQIVLELLSSFMLRVASRHKDRLSRFIQTDSAKAYASLSNVLLKHGVCKSTLEARETIIPALIQNGVIPLPSKKIPNQPQKEDFRQHNEWNSESSDGLIDLDEALVLRSRKGS